MDFHDESKIIADLTKLCKNVRLASIVETGVAVSVLTETAEKAAPQRRQTAQKPQVDVGKTSKTAAAKTLAAKLRSSPPGVSGDSS